jgi:cyclopropane-fatty-acyl-phospholipid synthase
MSEGPRVHDGVIGTLVLAFGKRLMPRDLKGSLTLTLPSGRIVVIGKKGEGFSADLILRNYKAIWASMRRGQLGFFDCYMAGDVTSSDPTTLFRFYLSNRPVLDRAASGLFTQSLLDKIWHKRRDNNKRGSKENIAAHYDLGNDFYKLWLDDTMSYSSAVFGGTGNSLEAAQRQKYARVMDALELKSGQKILEIGCGWGGFAEEAARRKAQVRGITLSAEQLAYAQKRIEDARLADRASFHFEDYRDTRGTFDGIASIEMIEAVGEKHWPTYFTGVDFIQRYVFPGGMLLTKSIIKEQAHKAGLVLERAEHFGQSYATTLRLWHQRFEEAWPQALKHGFDERFRQLWKLYLSYCEAGFAEEVVDVGIYKLRKPV